MKTTFLKKEDVKPNWYIVDASDKILGTLATKIAVILRGKNKTSFSPHVDGGDYVIVINAEKIKVTGKKLEDKTYYSHSGQIGKLKSMSLKEKLEKKPTYVLEHAVKGMIPRNRLRKPIMRKLKVYAGEVHEHEAQKPKKLEL